MLQNVTTLCAWNGRLLSIGPIWRRQASHGEGKGGPVETGLTGPVATDWVRGEGGVAGEGRVVAFPKFHSWGKCTMPLTNINSD